MAEQFYTILTKIGKAKIANSAGFGSKVNFVKMKVGDGGGSYYNPTENQEDLVNAVYEGNINHITIDEENPNWIKVEMMIPANVGGFMIREYGIFDEENNMLGVAKCPETYKPVAADGSTKELLMRMNLEVSNTQNVTLKIDPTIIFAKKSDLELLENKIENLKVISAEDFLDESVTIEGEMHPLLKEEFEKVESKMADMEKDIENIDLSAEKVNLDSTKLKSKTVKEGMEELFTFADNYKKSVANVVGSPVLATDTAKQVKSKIQGLKNTFASNLSSKQVSANGTERLGGLIGKVNDINIGGIKSVQRISTYTFEDQVFTINPVNIDKTITFSHCSWLRSDSIKAINAFAFAKLVNNINVKIKNPYYIDEDYGKIDCVVVEFNNVKQILRGEVDGDTSLKVRHITLPKTIDINKSLLSLQYIRCGNYNYSCYYTYSGVIEDNNTIRLEVTDIGGVYHDSIKFYWQIVEFN
ncbi:phage tail protein [Clostridium rectalis]|uniref:phage tail protein n=1 Tax=Clostridium rectalis TaxID=2040295 RepID=UPI000F640DAB|nr:phage tail protein [Clostridium rectalis]